MLGKKHEHEQKAELGADLGENIAKNVDLSEKPVEFSENSAAKSAGSDKKSVKKAIFHKNPAKNAHFDENSTSPSSPENTGGSQSSSQNAESSQNSAKNSQSPAKTAELQRKNADLTADLQRTRADFENFRKQTDAQREQAKQVATEATVAKFLPLIDNFELALAQYPEQLAPLAKTFAKTLADLELAQIDSAAGAEFNPDLHEAVLVEGEGETETVAETLRPGYLYQGAVLRPAMVKVRKS